jgi:hypothetical protein
METRFQFNYGQRLLLVLWTEAQLWISMYRRGRLSVPDSSDSLESHGFDAADM